MNASSLSQFFEGRVSSKRFAAEIKPEVAEYQRGVLSRKGASVPIRLLGEHSELEVNALGLRRLCEAFLEGVFSRWELHYVSDALTLSEATFASVRLRDLVEDLANPEVRETELSIEEVVSIRDELVSIGQWAQDVFEE